MPSVLDDTLYNLSLDVIEKGIADIGFITKRLGCTDNNAETIISKMQEMGVISDDCEPLTTVSEFKKRYVSDWQSKGFPRWVK